MAALLLSIYGCPYSSSYKLDSEPLENVDTTLNGKWAIMVATMDGMQPLKVIINEKNDKEYYINFIGYMNDLKAFNFPSDTIKGTAFISIVGDLKFFNIQIKGQTYITELLHDDKTLSILPLAECFTAKYIRSGHELRTAVAFHFKTRLSPIYDESFCLRNMVRVN